MPDETAVIETAPVSTGSESTPSPTTDTTPAPAPVETTAPAQVDTAAAPEFKSPAREQDEDNMAYMRRVREAREAFATGKPAAEAPKLAEVPAVEPAKPTEPAKEESKPGEIDPDALTAEELEDLQGISTTELADKLKANPELDAKLEAAGIRDGIFKNARLADKAIKFTEVFPGGLQDATHARDQAATLGDLDNIASAVQDVDSVKGFYQALMPLSYVLDDDGKPIPAEGGGFQTDGTVNRIIGQTVRYAIGQFPQDIFKDVMASPTGKDMLLKEIESLSNGSDDDETKAVLEFVQERIGQRASAAKNEPQAGKEKELFEKEQSLNAEKIRLDQQRQTADSQKANDNERAVATAISARLDKLIDSTFANFAIPEFNKKTAMEEIRKALYDQIEKDPVFKSQANQLSRRQHSERTTTERVGLALRTAKSMLMTVARPILKEAGANVIGKQQAKLDKINTQTEVTRRTESKGSSAPVGSAPKLTPGEASKKAKENLVSRGIDPDDTIQLMREMQKVRQSGQ